MLSELPQYTKATQYTFPARNRIMAALSKAVVVIECEERSGTRITARFGVEYGKEVCAVPHNIFADTGAGTNALIAQGAHLVKSGADIANILGLESIEQEGMVNDAASLTEIEKKVYTALSEPLSKTALTQKTQLSLHDIQSALTLLELKGLVQEALGKVSKIA